MVGLIWSLLLQSCTAFHLRSSIQRIRRFLPVSDINSGRLLNLMIRVMFFRQSVHEGRIYTVKLFCDKDYPDRPPSVRFHSRINMTSVNQDTGVVDPRHFSMLAQWRREYTMENILTELKREMAAPSNRKLQQPPEGSIF